jgi:hypothetical protein
MGWHLDDFFDGYTDYYFLWGNAQDLAHSGDWSTNDCDRPMASSTGHRDSGGVDVVGC